MARTRSTNPWLVFPRPNPQAEARLFCFHYAGGGATLFHKWPECLLPNVEVCAIQLPGRGSRLTEPLLTGVAPVVEALAPVIRPYLDRPFIFFGHSMGALIAFELTRHLRAAYDVRPAHLFVSGRRAPQLPIHTAYHLLPDAEFLQRLRSLNGTPAAILENAELMQLMLPVLRADFMLCETYRYSPQPPLDCPISAFGGLYDPDVSHAHLEAWRAQTTAAFKVQLFPGDHFFVHSALPLLLQVLGRNLHHLVNTLEAQYYRSGLSVV